MTPYSYTLPVHTSHYTLQMTAYSSTLHITHFTWTPPFAGADDGEGEEHFQHAWRGGLLRGNSVNFPSAASDFDELCEML